MSAGGVLTSCRLLRGVAPGVDLCEDQGVAHGGVDSDAEEVAETSDVASGRVDLLQPVPAAPAPSGLGGLQTQHRQTGNNL